MGILNVFKKKGNSNQDDKKNIKGPDFNAMLKGVDTSNLSMMQKMALKMFQKMPAGKQEEVIRKAMNPQSVMKNKDKVLRQMDEMVKSGQISKDQANRLKSQLGLR